MFTTEVGWPHTELRASPSIVLFTWCCFAIVFFTWCCFPIVLVQTVFFPLLPFVLERYAIELFSERLPLFAAAVHHQMVKLSLHYWVIKILLNPVRNDHTSQRRTHVKSQQHITIIQFCFCLSGAVQCKWHLGLCV